MKKKIFVVLGNQLFDKDYFNKFKNDHYFFMCEDHGLCNFQKHHKQKILFFLSSMRSFADELIENKYELIYKKIEDKDFIIDYSKKLITEIEDRKITDISIFEIEDKPFEKHLLSSLKGLVKVNYLNSPMFLNSRNEFKKYLCTVKKPLMAHFYKKQRLKHNILIDAKNKPVGGKWSFDKENRKKIPKEITFPKKFSFNHTNHTEELKKIIETKFPNNPGNVENFWVCTKRKDVHRLFDYFIDNKIEFFGDYEDSVDQRDNILFHSALSPHINVGLLTPNEIIKKLKMKSFIKLNSYEGYIRQIIGWREFMRGIYQNFDERLENNNFFNHKRKMKSHWYSASTGLVPLDFSIRNVQKYGWTHHIERLMILCNIMNLCEIEPKLVYKWFMEMFVDSSDWVMAPNVYGMGLFSDGGIFSTKPYICGSSYFLKMMDFNRGTWCEIMDGLYWRFISRNKKFFLANPRLSMMVRILEKMTTKRKEKIFVAAENFINRNTYVN